MYVHVVKAEPASGYRHDSQFSCRSVLSRKSVEKTLGGVWGASGARSVPPWPPSPFPPPLGPLAPPPPPPPTVDISSQSMLSKEGSKSSPVEWVEKPRSDVSMGEGGWSRMLGVLSIWLCRSSIRVRAPSSSTPNRGLPVVLSKKSSRRIFPALVSPGGGCGEARGSLGTGEGSWSGDGGEAEAEAEAEAGEGGSEWRGTREGFGLALRPGISEKETKRTEGEVETDEVAAFP